MVKSHSRIVTGAVACGLAVGAVAFLAVLPAVGSPAPAPRRSSPGPTASIALSSADLDVVDAEGSALATAPGSVVSVVRGPGTLIWNAVAPGVTTLDTMPKVMAHDFLLVSCTDHVLQTGYRAAPGAEVPVVGEIQMVIDETTGHVLATTRIPKGMTNSFAPADAVAKLGNPTVVMLSAVSFG